MFSGDISDQFFFNNEFGGDRRYPNPFFNVPLQYLPTNMDGQLWWAEHFLLRFEFYRTALTKIADYFITQISVDCDDEESKDEYKEIFEQIRWKEICSNAGLNLLAYSNSFVSINQGFNRFLCCPQCKKFSLIDRLNNFTFDKGKYTYTCPTCSFKGVHRLVDKPVKDVEKINVVNWNPREIKLRYEELTGAAEYYWEIPVEYKKKVTNKKDKFYPKHVPKAVYDAIYGENMIQFSTKTFLHLKLPTPASIKTDGKSVPLSMYMFDSFFMLKVLERFNEVICYEDINPFRVISMADNVAPNNPILAMQDGGKWGAAVDAMIDAHRRDPGSYHKFPFPINFQHLAGDGKQLAPLELIEMARKNILNAYNLPQELYTMTMQEQDTGASLMLFENSWRTLVDAYNTLLQHIGDVISKIRGLTPAKIKLQSVTLSKDMERKSVIGQLVSSNSIARSEFLELFDYDFKDQVRKKMQEDMDVQEVQEEETKRKQLKDANKASIFGQQGTVQGAAAGMGSSPGENVGSGAGMSPQDILQQAQEIAQQLQPQDGAARRQELQKIKAQNETLWSAVKAQLQQMDSGAKSQGLKQSKQQGQGQ